MSVKIRLARKGRKGQPSYNLVVADARASRDGKFIEKLGNYDPIKKFFDVDVDKALYWLSKGAQPTDTARNFLSKRGVMYKRHLQIGVQKGSITQDLADSRFSDWVAMKKKGVVYKMDQVAQKGVA